jgi:hypothetical protein
MTETLSAIRERCEIHDALRSGAATGTGYTSSYRVFHGSAQNGARREKYKELDEEVA